MLESLVWRILRSHAEHFSFYHFSKDFLFISIMKKSLLYILIVHQTESEPSTNHGWIFPETTKSSCGKLVGTSFHAKFLGMVFFMLMVMVAVFEARSRASLVSFYIAIMLKTLGQLSQPIVTPCLLYNLWIVRLYLCNWHCSEAMRLCYTGWSRWFHLNDHIFNNKFLPAGQLVKKPWEK